MIPSTHDNGQPGRSHAARVLAGLWQQAGCDPDAQDQVTLVTSDTLFGRVRHVAPAAKLSETPARWARPTVPLGTDAPIWADA